MESFQLPLDGGAGKQWHLGTQAGSEGCGSKQAARFGNLAGGTARGQKQSALRQCLA